ncbi:MAG: hypothetical protein G8345_14720 [Magnetococcales bacterium]|nr:hypothetical protein [Magnetococcales bacterium]
MTNWQVVWISPAGYLHGEALRELAEGLVYGLRGLGLQATLQRNALIPNARAIVVGGHLLPPALVTSLPLDSIIYNTEQIDPTSGMLHEGYWQLLHRHEVWDYSQRNMERLRQAGVKGVLRHVPLGYVQEWSRIAPAVEETDVLFYGSLNDRRRLILEQLRAAGLRVRHLFGVYGRERDGAIASSRLVLNMHFYPAAIFESVRVSYLMANGKAVVAECGDETEMDEGLRPGLALARYEDLVTTCQGLLADEPRRKRLQQDALATLRRRPFSGVLGQALGVQRVTRGIPGVLNLGSGGNWREDCLNLDRNPACQPDVVWDLNQPLPLGGEALPCARFGPVQLVEEQFEQILALDVLQHIHQLSNTMDSMLKVLKVGGQLTIRVPYDLSLQAWQDPYHVRGFNENSWLYYGDWYWYMGWKEARFDVVSLNMVPSIYGKQLIDQGQATTVIARQPRAVEAMVVVLKKRLLTPQEKAANLSLTGQL